MNQQITEKAMQLTEAVRAFCHDKSFTSYRLVEYCGYEMIGALDIDVSEVEARISVAIMEGYNTMWTEDNGRFVLCIWEPWDEPVSPPDWEKVLAERDLG